MPWSEWAGLVWCRESRQGLLGGRTVTAAACESAQMVQTIERAITAVAEGDVRMSHGQYLRRSVVGSRRACLVAIAVATGISAASAEPPDQSDAVQRLGAKLFFDRRLSADGNISCASCHIPEQAFSDGKATAEGVRGERGSRNTPSLINVSAQGALFWDGRRDSLEEQAGDPFINRSEHGLGSHAELIQRLQADPSYEKAFMRAFGEPIIEASGVFGALAAFQRSLQAGQSVFEQHFAGVGGARLSAAAQRGYALFVGRGQCSSCHLVEERTAPLTDGKFHAIGIGLGDVAERLPALVRRVSRETPETLAVLLTGDRDLAALGRFVVSKDPRDIGAFRTPSLHNVAVTAPYMHDGSVATLEEAVAREVHYRGQQVGRALILTAAERADLVEFLKALTSSELQQLAEHVRRQAR